MSFGLSRIFLEVLEALRSLLFRLEAVEIADVIEADLEVRLARLCWDVELGLAASETE